MVKRGKRWVIDGMDGAGKQTQTKLLKNRLEAEGFNVILVEFPNYDNYSSVLVKKYLGGEFERAKETVDNMTFIRQISSFYSVDRVATFIGTRVDGKTLLEHIEEGTHIICDRYTTSNILHQSANIADSKDVVEYIDWIQDLEYNKLGLPRPTGVIYLNVTPAIAVENIKRRYQGRDEEDIHENIDHLSRVFKVKPLVVEKCGWTEVDCCRNGMLLSKSEISDMIYNIVKTSLG